MGRWFRLLAAKARSSADRVGAAVDGEPTGELAATLLDFRLLADLASFHARQIPAAIELATYQETGDVEHLEGAFQHVPDSLQAWETLAERGAGAYHEDLSFQTTNRGQWADYVGDLEADRDELTDRLAEAGIDPDSIESAASDSHSDFGDGTVRSIPSVTVDVPDATATDEDVPITGRVGGMSGLDDLRLHYRRANQREGAFESVEVTTDGDAFRGTVLGAYVTDEFDLLVYLTATDDAGESVVIPGIYHASESFPLLRGRNCFRGGTAERLRPESPRFDSTQFAARRQRILRGSSRSTANLLSHRCKERSYTLRRLLAPAGKFAA